MLCYYAWFGVLDALLLLVIGIGDLFCDLVFMVEVLVLLVLIGGLDWLVIVLCFAGWVGGLGWLVTCCGWLRYVADSCGLVYAVVDGFGDSWAGC